MNAVIEQAGTLPLKPLCDALGVSRATVYRQKSPAVPPPPRATPVRALADKEQAAVVELLTCERFVDRSPGEVFYTLLDEGRYVCSERTMYRILAARDEVRERRNQRVHPVYTRPELVATAPNQVWSWDISRLRMTVKWSYLYLYVILDIFSRKVVGWMIARQETAALAKQLIEATIDKADVAPNMLVLHADRGAQMRSKTLAQLLADLDVARSFSRPHVSNDNPFSESHFKTAKYHPSYPGKFSELADALAWGREFFPWYNVAHRHSGIAYLAPADVHAGRADELLQARHDVHLGAHAEHPERFPKGPPQRQVLPPAVYINPPAAAAEDTTVEAAPSPASTAAGAGAPSDDENASARSAAGVWGLAEPPVPASDAGVQASTELDGAKAQEGSANMRAPTGALFAGQDEVVMQAGLRRNELEPMQAEFQPRETKEVDLQ